LRGGVLSGHDVCRRIRAQPWGKEMHLIAMTGWDQQDDRRRTEEAGFNHHLVKPVDPGTLIELLASLDT
jgi:CheY-like chemotaxis protein